MSTQKKKAKSEEQGEHGDGRCVIKAQWRWRWKVYWQMTVSLSEPDEKKRIRKGEIRMKDMSYGSH